MQAQDKPTAASTKNYLPGVGDLLFIGVCQLLLFMRPSLIFSDGSTGWHIVGGRYILDHLGVPAHDIFSFTFPQKHWVAYEWLFEAMAAGLDRLGGLPLVAVVIALALASLVLLLYQNMRKSGTPVMMALIFSIFGLLASANHWLVRPHVFTFFGVYCFYVLLDAYWKRQEDKSLDHFPFPFPFPWRHLFLPLSAMMLIWVNFHPAFLLGFVLVGVYAFSACLQWIAGTSKLAAKRTGHFVLLAVILLCVILCNPYGIDLFHYIGDYLKGSTILAQTDEFKSPNFKGNIHAICLEILFAFLVFGLYLRGAGSITLPSTLCLIVFAFMALSSQRNIPLFALICLPCLGHLFAGANKLYTALTQRLPDRLKASIRDFGVTEGQSTMHILPVVYGLILVVMAMTAGNKSIKADFDVETAPSETLVYLERNKGVIKAQKLLALDNWGGILTYRLGMPVYIDDRADFYGQDFYSRYGVMCEARPGYERLLSEAGLDYVLFPRESTLVARLKADGWKTLAEDRASTLVARP